MIHNTHPPGCRCPFCSEMYYESSAFPVVDPQDGSSITPGMSLRDYYAGQCLVGLSSLGNLLVPSPSDPESFTQADIVASQAYFIADAMLHHRHLNSGYVPPER